MNQYKIFFYLTISILVLWVVALVSITMSGCSLIGIEPPPSVCDEAPSDSVICRVCSEMGTTPEAADLILQAAALRALDEHDKSKVLTFYDDIEYFIGMSINYTELIDYVQDRVNLTGPEILLISLYLPKFESPQMISQFDKYLLLAHIDHMRAILAN